MNNPAFFLIRQQLLAQLAHSEHTFAQTLAFIEQHFNYQASGFKFAQLESNSEQNQGSCKIFALAQLLNLTQAQTLLCFGEHYRHLNNTAQDSHLNLRQLAKIGRINIEFEHFPLSLKENI